MRVGVVGLRRVHHRGRSVGRPRYAHHHGPRRRRRRTGGSRIQSERNACIVHHHHAPVKPQLLQRRARLRPRSEIELVQDPWLPSALQNFLPRTHSNAVDKLLHGFPVRHSASRGGTADGTGARKSTVRRYHARSNGRCEWVEVGWLRSSGSFETAESGGRWDERVRSERYRRVAQRTWGIDGILPHAETFRTCSCGLCGFQGFYRRSPREPNK